jgi:hypothetical protein
MNQLKQFLAKNSTDYWIIASDYVIGDKDRRHDSLCYTIYPLFQDHPLKPWAEIPTLIAEDLKSTSQIDDRIIACLRDASRFSFCFILPKRRHLFKNLTHARQNIDDSIVIMQGWKDADTHLDLIRRMGRLRQSAKSKAFNTKLLSDIMIVSTIAAVLAYYLTKLTQPRIISWFSDRDDIISAYSKVAHDLFAINHSAMCREQGVPYSNVKIGLGDPRPDPRAPSRSWYDALVRVPDFLAGTLAAFNYVDRTFEGGKQKIPDLLTKVFCEAENIAILVLDVKPELYSCASMRIGAPSPVPDLDSVNTNE